MNTPKVITNKAELDSAQRRLEELKRSGGQGNQDEVRQLTESVDAYKRSNPDSGSQQSNQPPR
jgi:hypothetical protein